MTEKNLKDIESFLRAGYEIGSFRVSELIAEVRELQLEVKVLSAVVKHYNTTLIRTLKEAGAMVKRRGSDN